MVVALAACSLAAGHFASNASMGIVAGVALALAAWRLWIPVRFEISSKGVVQSVLGRRRRIPWVEFARYDLRRRGVLLLTEMGGSPLVAFRSLYVGWNDYRQELLDLLDFFIEPRAESHPATTQTYQPQSD
jgi:hypothetical protein